MTDLCREFQISRKTGYKIQERYKAQSLVGLYDVKRAPEHIPHRTSRRSRIGSFVFGNNNVGPRGSFAGTSWITKGRDGQRQAPLASC
ncbi:MAG: hypothetical protein JWM74_573 [Myxococcaceae bacterium]|nr:hypothetical protein [Myxococcaceae bacterium]